MMEEIEQLIAEVDVHQQDVQDSIPVAVLSSKCIGDGCKGRLSRKFSFDFHRLCVSCRPDDCSTITCVECCS